LGFVGKDDFFVVAGVTCVQELGAGIERHALATEHLLQRGGGIAVELVEHVGAALDQSDPHAKAGKELGELDRHRPAPQNNE